MITANELWYTIHQCSSKHELTDEAWKKLKEIAVNMEESDFTFGSAAEIGKKLCVSLGYDDIDSFRKDSRLQDDVDFLGKFVEVVCTEFGGIPNRLYDSGVSIEHNGKMPSGNQLGNKFHEVVNRLLENDFYLTQRRDKNGIRLIDIISDWRIYDNTLSAIFKKELTKARAISVVSQAKERRRMG